MIAGNPIQTFSAVVILSGIERWASERCPSILLNMSNIFCGTMFVIQKRDALNSFSQAANS
jgi:hypothetical protein